MRLAALTAAVSRRRRRDGAGAGATYVPGGGAGAPPPARSGADEGTQSATAGPADPAALAAGLEAARERLKRTIAPPADG